MKPPRNGTGHHGTNGHATNGHANGHAPRFEFPDRLPPQNLEAEMGVLGSVLRDNSTLPEVMAILRPGDFYRDSHQVLYRGILELHAEGLPADAILLSERLTQQGLYDRLGGDDALTKVLDAVPHAANARYYAQIVAEKATTRRALDAAQETLREAYAGTIAADEIVARFRTRAEGLSAPRAIAGDGASASLADVRRLVGDRKWLWEGWIVEAHLTVLAAKPGVGKTRLALDLCRRMWAADAWPDGTLAARPPGTPSLWVAADRNHAEIAYAARDFGLPDDAVLFNAPPLDPFGGLNLDEAGDVADLARRIERARPGLLIIDTVNKATRRSLYRPEEAEAFFGPLLDVARDLRTPILALTHLSKAGEPLDRRIEGICRVLWSLTQPDPDGQGDRRRLWVSKSFAPYPPPLGITLGQEGNAYDGHPPVEPGPDGGGRPDAKTAAAMAWLRARLAAGPIAVARAIEEAEAAGLTKRTLYRAKDALGVETDEGFDGRRKLWRLPAADDCPEF
jgi:hypothetical protein